MNFLVMPLFFLSGALFPVDSLSKGMGIVTRLDPMAYGVDALRGILNGATASSFGTSLDFIVLLALVTIVTAIGSWQFSKIEI
jgi:ABC-2 type transport system permease protein